MGKIFALIFLLLSIPSSGFAQTTKFNIDAGECGERPVVTKTLVWTERQHETRMFGRLESVSPKGNSQSGMCHIVYELVASRRGLPYSTVHRMEEDVDMLMGQSTGIDLIGFSPDGSKLAANYWLAQGDWVENRLVVYDLKSKSATFRSLEQNLYENVQRECDGSYWEDIESVTNKGMIRIAVPPLSGCSNSDGGLWLFDPKSGDIRKLSPKSGKKPL